MCEALCFVLYRTVSTDCIQMAETVRTAAAGKQSDDDDDGGDNDDDDDDDA